MFPVKFFLKPVDETMKKKRTNHTVYGRSHDMADLKNGCSGGTSVRQLCESGSLNSIKSFYFTVNHVFCIYLAVF